MTAEQTALPAKLSFEAVTDFMRAHPGETAESLGLAFQKSRSQMQAWLSYYFFSPRQPRVADFVRVKAKTATGSNKYLWYLPEHAPAEAEWPEGCNPNAEPVAAAVELVPGQATDFGPRPVASLIFMIVKARPGITNAEICALTGWARRPLAQMTGYFSQPQKKIPARLARVGDSRNAQFYLPEDLPVANAPEALIPEEAEPEILDAAEPMLEATPAALPQRYDPQTASPAASIIAGAMDYFVQEIARAVVMEVEHRLEATVALQVDKTLRALPQRLSAALAAPRAEAPAPSWPKEEPKRGPRVLLVGCKPDLYARVKDEFDDVLCLDNFDNSKSKAELRKTIGQAAHIFVNTSFISHAHSDTVKKSGRPYTLISGGIDTLRHNLNTYVATLV